MSQPRARWWTGIVIVGFWLLMMGWLLRSELGIQRLGAGAARQLPRLETPTDSWMGVYVGDRQRVGYVHVRQAPQQRHGLAGAQMTLEAKMRLNLLGKATDLDLTGDVWRPYQEAVAEFEFAVRSAEYDFRIAGDLGADKLSAEVVSAGETFPLELPVSGEMVFSSGLGTTLELPLLEVGEEYRLESFDPLTMRKSAARIRCVAHETLNLGGVPVATRRLQMTMSGIRSQAWVDESGEVVRAETPVGLVLEKITAAQALLPDVPGDAAGELLGRTAIRPTGPRPFRTARRMTIALSGLDDLELPIDRVQVALGDGRYRLAVPGEPATASLAPQTPATPSTAPQTPSMAPYLAADTFVQADHPKIRRQAADIVGDESDPWRRARSIHDWVFTRLEKEAVVSIPSALEVLEHQRGDCNEHTVLFTALARAAGLPTRIAIGIVWSDALDGFYYHAWPEVHLGDGWTWMDPTLDQPLADATHLKLLNGGIETWPQLLPYLGRLQVEVLDIE